MDPTRVPQDTLLLDRCILEETLQDKDSRHREENDRLRVEFQLERSDLRKQRREVGLFSIVSSLHLIVTYVQLGGMEKE